MGSTSWSDDFYRHREETRAKKGETAFVYNAAVAAKPAAEQKVHDAMSPKRKKIREARDSAEHPNSLPIGVFFDITGSMQRSPEAFQKKLGDLMTRLVTHEYVTDPQILIGCIGDTNDRRDAKGTGIFDGSCQVGEFESGIEIDDCLGRCWLAGGGGGSVEESYQNAAYFFARHVQADHIEKGRGKGCLFMLGDENPYPTVKRGEVEALFGDVLQEDIPTPKLFAELREKWDVYFIIPRETSNGTNAAIRHHWEKLLGKENVFSLDKAENVSELIALVMGIREGKVTDLEAARSIRIAEGLPAATVQSLVSSVADYAASKGVVDQSKTARL